MTLLRGAGLLGSFFVFVALGGCGSAANDVGRNTPPLAKDVALISAVNPAHVGDILQGSYRYLDTDGDGESGTLLVWLRDGQPIDGANQAKYEVAAEDSGKKLQFRVTPAAGSGEVRGETVDSSGITIENSAPEAINVILDIPRVGVAATLTAGVTSKLSVKYQYRDVDKDAEGATEIRWVRHTADSAVEFIIPNATDSTYIVTSEDLNHILVAEITPLAQTGERHGAEVHSQTVFILNSVPVAKDVKVTLPSAAPVIVGTELTGSYTYFDVDNDTEDKSNPKMQELQWLRNDQPIPGANALTHILTPADANARIQFSVMPHAKSGTSPGEMVMTEAIQVINSPPQASNVVVSVNGSSVASAFALVGDILDASYKYSDLDLDPEDKSTYRWLRSGTPGPTAIANATGKKYLISAADSGKDLIFEVTPRAAGQAASSIGQAVSSTPINIKNSPPVARNVQAQLSPGNTITPINVGSVLEAKYTYFDADNDLERTGANGTTIQWFRNGIAITGATGTGPTYILVAADVGIATTVTLSFDVTPVSVDGTKGSTIRSNGISNNNLAPTATGVVIALPPGGAVVGAVLKGTYTYKDTENDPEGVSLYEWSNGARVLGTNRDYAVTATDAHQTLTFKVTPLASAGASRGDGVTSPGMLIDNSAPSVTGLVINSSSVDGRAYKDVKLTASYSFQDPDGDLEGATSYQWLSNNQNIGGATQQSYTVVYPVDIDKALTVQVTPRDNYTPTKAGTSVASAPIIPVNLAPVAIDVFVKGPGTVPVYKIGDALTVTYKYTDLEGDLEAALRPATNTRSDIQWLRTSAPPNPITTSIPGANSDVYILTLTDANQTIAAQVTPLAATGKSPGLAVMSNAVTVPNTAPVARNVTLTAVVIPSAVPVLGTVLNANYEYFDAEGDAEGATTTSWLRDGKAITDASGVNVTGKIYTAVRADVGTTIQYEVTPRAATGIANGKSTPSPGIAIRNSVPVATAPVITPATAGPVLVGTPLTASFAYSDVDGDVQGKSIYEWSNGTAVISTSTSSTGSSTYTVTAAAHKTLSVKITPVASTGTGANTGIAVTSPGVVIDNSPPSVTGLMIKSSGVNGQAYSGVTLTASYGFNDPDGDGDASTYQWFRGTTLLATTTKTYSVTLSDISVPILPLTVQVTPKDNFVPPLTGALVTSPPITPVNLVPVASNVLITPSLVGDTLTVGYKYYDNEGDLELLTAAGTQFQWFRGLNAITSATTPTYTLTPADAGQSITVKVTPFASAGTNPGLAVTSPPFVPANIVLNVTSSLKQLHFSWAKVPGAATYRVSYKPDVGLGFIPLSTTSSGLLTTTYDWDISVHRLNWQNAQFMLEACDAASVCSPSVPISALSVMLGSIGYIKASNPGMNDWFGVAVALSADGNTLAVGAYQEDSAAIFGPVMNQTDDCNLVVAARTNCAVDSGAVYVYARAVGGSWSQQAYIKASNTDLNDGFGIALALSADGNTLAVGAYAESGAAIGVSSTPTARNGCSTVPPTNCALYSGAAYVYTRVGTSWSPPIYFKASNTGTSAYFGRTLALSADGKTLAVGAWGEDSAATFGVNSNQNYSCITIPNTNCAVDSGAVYVYTLNVSGWSPPIYIKASNTKAGDFFGFGLALSSNGNTLAVGAFGESSAATFGVNINPIYDCITLPTTNCAANSGAAYVYTRMGGNWSPPTYIKASNTKAGDGFGVTLALSADGNTLAVGAYQEKSSATGVGGIQTNGCPKINCATNSGAAYVYTFVVGSGWSPPSYIKASNTAAGDHFGYALTLSADGNTLAVGADLEGSAATGMYGNPIHACALSLTNCALNSGAVYVYTRVGVSWLQPISYVKASNAEVNDHFGYSLSLSGDGTTLAVGAHGEASAATGVNNTVPGQRDNSVSSSGAVYLY